MCIFCSVNHPIEEFENMYNIQSVKVLHALTATSTVTYSFLIFYKKDTVS